LLAERFRRAGVSTVIGGLNVTAEPEEALEHCDAVVVGEGEVSWPRVSRTPSLASSPPRPAVHGRHQQGPSRAGRPRSSGSCWARICRPVGVLPKHAPPEQTGVADVM
jgi:hypothetical protein